MPIFLKNKMKIIIFNHWASTAGEQLAGRPIRLYTQGLNGATIMRSHFLLAGGNAEVGFSKNSFHCNIKLIVKLKNNLITIKPLFY